MQSPIKYCLRILIIGVLVLSAGRVYSQDSKRRDQDLTRHAQFASAVATLTRVTIYEGLPGKTKLLASELKVKKTLKLRDYHFYSETLSISEADATALTKILADRASIAKYEQKFCGFHPDYCLEWKIGKETWQALLCLGCGEVKYYGPKNMRLHCDLEKETLEKLKGMLKDFKMNRPAEDTEAAP